jgi:hypothetical protein
MEQNMRKMLAALALCGLFVPPALAASASVEAAIKTFEAVAADPARLKIFCEMNELTGDDQDESNAEAIDKQMKQKKELGSDVETAFEAGADLDPDSDDGKAYDTALDGLDAKCGG